MKNWYLNELDKYPLLTEGEERKLLIAAKAGNSAAYNKLITSNLKFVVSIANRYQNSHGSLALEDLISEGNLGLIKAYDRYDLSKKVKFITYAVWWVRQSILSSIHQHAKTIKIPINKLARLQKIQNLKNSLFESLNREPLEIEIEDSLDNKNTQIFNYTMVNLDHSIVEGKNLHNIISLEPEYELDDEFMKEFEDVLSEFTDKEQQIVKMYFGLDGRAYTLKEIGNHYNLTRERVRQIKEKVLRRLRYRRYKDKLRIFLC